MQKTPSYIRANTVKPLTKSEKYSYSLLFQSISALKTMSGPVPKHFANQFISFRSIQTANASVEPFYLWDSGSR